MKKLSAAIAALLLLTIALFAPLGAFTTPPGSVLTPPKFQSVLASGPNAGGQVCSYVSGTTTPLATYTDTTLATPNPTCVTLDSLGSAYIVLGNTSAYRIVVKDSFGNTVSSTDGMQSGYLQFVSGNFVTNVASTPAYQNPASGAILRTLTSKLNDNVVSVKDCGAMGDGTTDDTTAVATCAAAVTGTGGTLYFPAGNYKMSAIPSLAGVNYVAYRGDTQTQGYAQIQTATIITYTGSSSPMLSMNGANDVQVSGIAFKATNASFTGTGTTYFDLGSCNLCSIDNNSIAITGTNASPAYDIKMPASTMINISSNTFGPGNTIIFGDPNSYNNGFSNTVNISQNLFTNFVNAIEDVGFSWVIQNNTFELINANARAIYEQTQSGTSPTFGSGVQITGNYFGDDTSSTQEIIDVYGYGWNISGNYIQGNYAQTGIVIAPYSSGININGNHIGSLLYNVTMASTSQDVVIQGNEMDVAPQTAPGGWSFNPYNGTYPGSGTLQDWGATVGTTKMFGTFIPASMSGPITVTGTGTNSFSGVISATGTGTNQFTGNVNLGNSAGTANSLQFLTNTDQILFGTDNSGYSLTFGKNVAGTVTTYLTLTDAGALSMTGTISASSTVNASGFKVSGTAGYTGTKTAGSCVLTITGGIITSVTGC